MLLAFASGCATVGAGQAGVLWRASGGTDAEPVREGRHLILPWQRLTVYDLRTHEKNEKLEVLAANGLALVLDATIHYHVDGAEVAELHRRVGPDYYEVLIGPVLRSRARRVVGRYTPEEIYSTKRDLIEWEILEALDESLQGRAVFVENVLIRGVRMPSAIQSAIVDKLAEEQRSLAMKYVIERERLEADRKAIEAGGIASYQDTVAAGATEPLLRWKQIEALSELGTSKNTKVLVLGVDAPPAKPEPAR